jgi:hypothetical protein
MNKKDIEGIEPLLWYEWGDEEEGEVTVWTVIKETFEIKPLGRIKKTELPEDAVYDCPYR